MWTKFYPILTPFPPGVDNCGHFTWYLPFVMWPSMEFVLTPPPLLVHISIECPLMIWSFHKTKVNNQRVLKTKPSENVVPGLLMNLYYKSPTDTIPPISLCKTRLAWCMNCTFFVLQSNSIWHVPGQHLCLVVNTLLLFTLHKTQVYINVTLFSP